MMNCGHECCCDSKKAHAASQEESLREFLRDPGPPPAHWSPEVQELVARAVERARIGDKYVGA